MFPDSRTILGHHYKTIFEKNFPRRNCRGDPAHGISVRRVSTAISVVENYFFQMSKNDLSRRRTRFWTLFPCFPTRGPSLAIITKQFLKKTFHDETAVVTRRTVYPCVEFPRQFLSWKIIFFKCPKMTFPDIGHDFGHFSHVSRLEDHPWPSLQNNF